MDLLIRNALVVTMNAQNAIVRAHVGISDKCIVYLGKKEPTTRAGNPTRIIDADGRVVLPGLIQCHVHIAQTLFRGLAEDLRLLDWLRKRIWPLEATLDQPALRASAELGLLELLRGGTTCILDMGTVHHHEVVFEAMERSGIRGFSGKAMMDRGRDVPAGLKESKRASLGESLRLAEAWHGRADGRLGYAFAPRFLLSCSKALLREVAEQSQQLGLLVHTHIAENAAEREAVRSILGQDDLAALRALKIRGPHVVLAHAVCLRRSEMRQIANDATGIVHCPSANLKLGSGIADIKTMRDMGIKVGLGADGAACNNRLDMWTEMRLAALLAKLKCGDPAAVTAMDVLAMATKDAARLLRIDHLVGSIETGKRADLVIVGLGPERHLEGQDLAANLVYTCGASDVEHVFVDGQHLVKQGVVQTLDTGAIAKNAKQQLEQIQRRL